MLITMSERIVYETDKIREALDTATPVAAGGSATQFRLETASGFILVKGKGFTYDTDDFPATGLVSTIEVFFSGRARPDASLSLAEEEQIPGGSFTFFLKGDIVSILEMFQGKVEDFQGGAKNDTFQVFDEFLNVTNDIAHGGGGNDIIDLENGNDTSFGDAGNDRLIDRNGDKFNLPNIVFTGTFDGGTGIDTLELFDQTGDRLGFKINLNLTGFQNTNHGKQKFINIENVDGGIIDGDVITGNAANNVIRGDGGQGGTFDANDVLNGGAGNDRLEGEDGADRLIGGTGNDRLLGGPNADFGSGADVLDGGAGNDTGLGGTGNDVLDGGSGNDVLSGDAGDDRIYGGTGNDRISGGLGQDTIRGGGGDDTIGAGNGAINAKGDIGDDIMSGGKRNDTMDGGGGNDYLIGGRGNDALAGGDGNDKLQGDAGSDTLIGGDGNDTLEGGANKDTMNGGAGADEFLFRKGHANDRITGFDSGEDSLHFTDLPGVDEFSDLQITGNGTATVVVTTPSGSIIVQAPQGGTIILNSDNVSFLSLD